MARPTEAGGPSNDGAPRPALAGGPSIHESTEEPWSRARGGPPRPGGRARAAPGCTGAGARPRPPLRRIRGRGRALAWRTAEEPAVLAWRTTRTSRTQLPSRSFLTGDGSRFCSCSQFSLHISPSPLPLQAPPSSPRSGSPATTTVRVARILVFIVRFRPRCNGATASAMAVTHSSCPIYMVIRASWLALECLQQ
jgi:hypothetical protein